MNAYVVYVRQYCMRNETVVAKFISTNILSRSQCCWDFKSIQYMQSSVLARVLFSLLLLYVDVPQTQCARLLTHSTCGIEFVWQKRIQNTDTQTSIRFTCKREPYHRTHATKTWTREPATAESIGRAYERASQPTEWYVCARERMKQSKNRLNLSCGRLFCSDLL